MINKDAYAAVRIKARKRTAKMAFFIAYLIQHGKRPSKQYVQYIAEQIFQEPWENFPDNAWAWAELEEPSK